jgi:hypothetical protein
MTGVCCACRALQGIIGILDRKPFCLSYVQQIAVRAYEYWRGKSASQVIVAFDKRARKLNGIVGA